MQGRHADLLPAYRVHLLANDVLDLREHAEPEREIRIHARHLFMNVAGANEELGVLHDLVCRRLPPRLREQFRLPHREQYTPTAPPGQKFDKSFDRYKLWLPIGVGLLETEQRGACSAPTRSLGFRDQSTQGDPAGRLSFLYKPLPHNFENVVSGDDEHEQDEEGEANAINRLRDGGLDRSADDALDDNEK